MVDTTNNTAENTEESENPQSILEKRLAEINSRKNEEPSRPSQELNISKNLNSDAVAVQENVQPSLTDPAAGLTTQNPGTEPEETNFHPPVKVADHQTETSTDVFTLTGPGSEEINLPEENTGIISGTTIKNSDAAAASPETNLNSADLESNPGFSVSDPSAEGILMDSGESLAATETGSPELLSTAGLIYDPQEEQPTTVETNTPEAGKIPAYSDKEASVPTAEVVPNEEVNLEEDHHEELAPQKDYSTFTVGEIRRQLSQMLKTATRQKGREVFELYRQYEAKLAEEKSEALQKFTSEGGAADDFDYKAGPEHQEIEKAFQQFRELRSREQRQDEEQKVKNARRKQELLDQLRELVESPETKSSGDKIKQIQSEWKGIGPVPAADSKQLWNSYHALLDIFYNNRSIFNELKELDRRRNLQHKIQLCERAESLIDQPSINVALQELRNLHEEWKHVGPVPNDQRDSIWERFIQASEKVHGRKKEFISARKSVEQENLIKKSELLFRMDPFQSFQTDRINDWRDKTDEIQKIKEEWDAIGLVPKDRADEINKRFWSSYKAFFNHKNAFFKNLDEQKIQNLRLKTELCEQAEGLKNSNDWDETKETLIQLQKKWKTIGRVPDKYSDKLWQRFRTACNEFFDRKQNQVTQKENEVNQASHAKSTLYEQLASRMTTLNTEPGNFAEFEKIRDAYLALPVTKFSGKTDDRFFDLLQKYVGSITDLNTEEKDNLAAQLQVTRLKNGPDAGNRIHQKEQAIKRDIGQLENDIRTLKTNIEFFGRSKNADKLREEYNARIAEADHRIQQLQRQLNLIRNS